MLNRLPARLRLGLARIARAAALIATLVPAGPALWAADDGRRPGVDFMSPALQAMQRDPTQNPALLAVREGEALWSRPAANGRSCAGCHGPAPLPGPALQYPRFDPATQRPLTLAGRIDRCRQQHLQAAPEPADGPEGLALAAALAWAARGQPIAPDADPRLAPWARHGGQLYRQRLGQLNLACLHCHDERAGQRLGGAVIPQAHPTGVPTYRLQWQGQGSLQRRIRNCLAGVRAEPFAAGSDEALAIELYLQRRAAGMALEGAAIRP